MNSLIHAGLDPDDVKAVILRCFIEDFGSIGDITSAATVPATQRLTASYVARVDGVAAGVPLLGVAAELHSSDIELTGRINDGERLKPGTVLATIDGPARAVLELERLTLNLLGRLCGVATVTGRWVDAVEGTGAKVRDTRKTTPGLRDLEKYAVRCGGGVNHRRGLDDGVLIKDNHIVAAGGISAALDGVIASGAADKAGQMLMLEVDDLRQLDEALNHEVYAKAPDDDSRQILLDNFTEADLRTAVKLIREANANILAEASGGLTIDRARAVAETGVDFLSVGALTHSAPVLDIALDA